MTAFFKYLIGYGCKISQDFPTTNNMYYVSYIKGLL